MAVLVGGFPAASPTVAHCALEGQARERCPTHFPASCGAARGDPDFHITRFAFVA